MSRRLTNLLLLGLVAAQVATGLAGWAFPVERVLPLYPLHRGLGVALVALLAWKYLIARDSLARRLGRDSSVVWGVLAALLLAGNLALGLSWTFGWLSVDSFWGYSALNLHVFLGLGLLPLLMGHSTRRWERRPSLARLIDRRAAVRLVGLGGAALVGWRAVEVGAAAWTPEERRVTGSKHVGSHSANAYPVTIWLFDPVPTIVADEWRLTLDGKLSQPGTLSYADLLAHAPVEHTAVLDCTGGWWSEQVWRGVRVGDLLDARGVMPGATAAAVVSTTGHRWAFPLDELREALLATHVGGEPLTPGHGYPVRLVAPGRRGFQWIKWVARIELV